MSKKAQAKVKECKVEKLESGETIIVTVYEAVSSKDKRKVKCRGRQTKDFDLIGGWQKNRSQAPKGEIE